jgi:N-acetylglucosaminyldiphosphoundecaprenol N-acetyl-beta-D-mannosaminyltransferase
MRFGLACIRAAAAGPELPATTASSKQAAPRRWPIGLLGVPFENITQQEAVDRIEAMIASGRPHYVVTANVDFLVQARRDVELRRILLAADLVLCDGTPLLWASRWLGNPLPERVAGSDVTPRIIAAAARKGQRLFLLGAQPGVAAAAAARLQHQHPHLVIAGHYSPPFGKLLDMDFGEIAARVGAARPDLLLVSFGCPKQEKWMAKHYHQLGVPVLIGVGATLDFIAGRVKRAPALMQRTGTECVYRLAQEPRRLFGRYAGDLIHFVPAIARQCLYLRGRRQQAAPLELIASPPAASWQEVRLQGDLSAPELTRMAGAVEAALGVAAHCRLDLSGVRFLDSTGAALLVQWHRRLHEQGKQLQILTPSAAVQGTLQVLQLSVFFNLTAHADLGTPALAGETPTEAVIPPYPGGHTLAWQGEITTTNAEAVWTLSVRYLNAGGAPPRNTHLINIARVQFIDSAGAELMGRLQRWAGNQGQRLRFIGPRPDVRNVLEMAGLARLLNGAPR